MKWKHLSEWNTLLPFISANDSVNLTYAGLGRLACLCWILRKFGDYCCVTVSSDLSHHWILRRQVLDLALPPACPWSLSMVLPSACPPPEDCSEFLLQYLSKVLFTFLFLLIMHRNPKTGFHYHSYVMIFKQSPGETNLPSLLLLVLLLKKTSRS